ncbi:phosphatase 2C-like domain-containing protein [Blyttiomyces helicus]|uniref:Phosphatase 2C-like domain-containing protein n=1 Tax=Blyttiomyces helicus TaxID=388810 RepID=A0A4P9W299_9FUNG|nr:phosphatase 2C-like domain-containing protein [Blyttiomyces helicus]|eukprot:RKO85293.1 phosphatase 2C-like domain-containing protein [Blyttiomyces helicus]
MPAFAGACHIVAHVEGDTLHVANSGDCRAVLGVRGRDGVWETVALSEDHQPSRASEFARIVAEHPGEDPARLVRKSREGSRGPLRVLGGLMPSRALGDHTYKWPLAWQTKLVALEESLKNHHLGRRFRPRPDCLTPPYVTALPEIRTHTLSDPTAPAFLIVACDGIWDEITNEQAVAAVAQWLETEPSAESPLVRDANAASHLVRAALAGGKDGDSELVSRLLTVPESEARSWRDDMTAIVVLFDGTTRNLKESGRAPWFVRDIVEV